MKKISRVKSKTGDKHLHKEIPKKLINLSDFNDRLSKPGFNTNVDSNHSIHRRSKLTDLPKFFRKSKNTC